MREIKFRAWDGERFIYFDTIEFLALPRKNKSMELIVRFRNETIGDIKHEIMQYTGLKDKNGKEIYEGDVICYEGEYKIRVCDGVKVRSPYWSNSIVVFVDGGFMGQIVAQENSHFGKLPSKPEKICVLYAEVIGNIHENPELGGKE